MRRFNDNNSSFNVSTRYQIDLRDIGIDYGTEISGFVNHSYNW